MNLIIEIDSNDNLKKSVINLEKEDNDLYSENEKFKKSVDKSLQKENDLLKERLDIFQKLIVFSCQLMNLLLILAYVSKS